MFKQSVVICLAVLALAAVGRAQDERDAVAKGLKAARELRLEKKFSEARKVLDGLVPEGRARTYPEWRELALTWSDEKKFGAAAKVWSDLISSFGAKPDFSNAQIKFNYFEARYEYSWCMYMYAKHIEDPKLLEKKPEYLRRVAKLIVELEEHYPDFGADPLKKRYDELLKNDDLRQVYDAYKKERADK